MTPKQSVMFCACGRSSILAKALCAYCYRARYRDRRYFGGHRERVLMRDALRCNNCGEHRQIVIHHRRPGINAARSLSTLCRRCHAKVHRLNRATYGMQPFLYRLWLEQHLDQPEQLHFPFFDDEPQGDHLSEAQVSLWAAAAMISGDYSEALASPVCSLNSRVE